MEVHQYLFPSLKGPHLFRSKRGPSNLGSSGIFEKKKKHKWENLFRILTENLEALDFYQDFCWTWTLVRLNVIVTWSVNVSVILNVIEILSVTCNKKVKCNLHKGWAKDNWNVVKRLLGTHTNGVTFRLFQFKWTLWECPKTSSSILDLVVTISDDFRSGCRNVSRHYRQQSLSGLHSSGRSDYTITY